MAGEFEIDYNGAKVYLKNNGKLKYEGSEEGQEKLKKALEPIFDYIKCYSNQSYLGNERRIDTYMEKELFKKLKSVFETYANDNIKDNELKLGDEFIKNDGYTNVAHFLYTKEREIQTKKTEQEKAALEEKRAEEEAQQRLEAEEAKKAQEAKEADEARQAAEFSAEIEKKAKAIDEQKAQDKEVFNASIMKMAAEVGTDAISGGETYTIKKGDSFWNIAKQSLKDEGIDKPNNKAIMKRMAEICALNNINMSTLKLRVGNTLTLPGAGGAGGTTPPAGGTTPPSGGATPPSGGTTPPPQTPTVSEATQSELNASDWDAESSATVWKDDGGNVIVVLPGDGTDLDDLESINATVWKDNDGNYHYVMNE